MEGFNMRQYAWKPAAEMVVTLLKIYEANYPEILKTCFIVNAPKVFTLAFAVVKKFMHEYTISKIKIYGTDSKKWKAQVLTMVEADQLPVYYGGSVVDDNGDPRCQLIVKPGGKVPKCYYTKNTSKENKKEYSKVTIKTGDTHVVDLLCADPESVLKWDLGVESHDIKWSVRRRDAEGTEEVVHGPHTLHPGAPSVGLLPVSGPATYSVMFDNSNAFMRSKKVYYDLVIAVPAKDLDTSDIPEDDASSSNSTAL
ncbi:hypothetical protein evm_012119 [Chilo suppressalis]|nr:hypothetical protein evm_012119 [Chilo suppressalis]